MAARLQRRLELGCAERRGTDAQAGGAGIKGGGGLGRLGQIVEECAPDEGCADGACVPACDAAVASGANFGCQFMVPTTPTWGNNPPPCFAAFLTNGWGHPAQLEARRGDQQFDPGMFARSRR